MLSYIASKPCILCVDYSPKTVTVTLIINFIEKAILVTIYPFNSSFHKILEVCRDASKVYIYLYRQSAQSPKVHKFLINHIQQLSHIFSNLW